MNADGNVRYATSREQRGDEAKGRGAESRVVGSWSTLGTGGWLVMKAGVFQWRYSVSVIRLLFVC